VSFPVVPPYLIIISLNNIFDGADFAHEQQFWKHANKSLGEFHNWPLGLAVRLLLTFICATKTCISRACACSDDDALTVSNRVYYHQRYSLKMNVVPWPSPVVQHGPSINYLNISPRFVPSSTPHVIVP
jgi:hypothetical protein